MRGSGTIVARLSESSGEIRRGASCYSLNATVVRRESPAVPPGTLVSDAFKHRCLTARFIPLNFFGGRFLIHVGVDSNLT